MGKITIDQSHQVMATLAVNTDWESIDFKNSGLQDSIIRNPKELGRQFTAFLKNVGKFVGEPKTIKIDRSMPFNPGGGWSIAEQDERSLVLTEVDPGRIRLETMLELNEKCIIGEERLKRLKKAGHIRLDAKIFQTFLENQHLIPEGWGDKTNEETTRILFDGAVLLGHRDSDRYVPLLCHRSGSWYEDRLWLDNCLHNNYPSAVLLIS